MSSLTLTHLRSLSENIETRVQEFIEHYPKFELVIALKEYINQSEIDSEILLLIFRKNPFLLLNNRVLNYFDLKSPFASDNLSKLLKYGGIEELMVEGDWFLLLQHLKYNDNIKNGNDLLSVIPTNYQKKYYTEVPVYKEELKNEEMKKSVYEKMHDLISSNPDVKIELNIIENKKE